MKPHAFNWFFEGVRVGRIDLRIVETQDEAEDYDHCWCANSTISEQLKVSDVAEGYPALLIRWMEIENDYQGLRHGSTLLKFAEDFALRHHCVFAFCKLEMNDIKDLELQAFYLDRGWSLLEETTMEAVTTPDPEAAWVMGYITPRPRALPDSPVYEAQEEEVTQWEKEMQPSRNRHQRMG